MKMSNDYENKSGATFIEYILNYIGQLRLYSYANLLLIFLWLHASFLQIIGCSLLWFGFLVYLETVHKDRGRARWHPSVWILLWLFGALLMPDPRVLIFYITAAAYSLKKLRIMGPFSSILNGLLKTSLVLVLPSATVENLAIIFVSMTLRNLAGDFRDARKDASENMLTLPIVLGYKDNIPYIYPLALAFTSILYGVLGHLHWTFVLGVIGIQLATYNWTPR